MKAIWITKPGGYDVLQVREAPDPEPQAGEVRIRVKASGLNFADLMARRGIYPDSPKLPCVVGYEVSGVVDRVGAGVTDLREGTRVLATTRFGGHADVVCAPAAQVLPIPDRLGFNEAAALPVNYLTAYLMAFHVAGVRPGNHVLVHQAAGGVGLAMLQILKTVPGVTVYGTASPSKHELLRKAGCHHPIDYTSQDYAVEIKRITNGRGVSAVFDALGGADWKKGYELLHPSGKLVTFGWANMSTGTSRSLWTILKQVVQMPFYTPAGLMKTNRSVAGFNLGSMWSEMAMLRETLLELLKLYDQGVVRPHVDSTYSFEKAGEAHKHIEDRKSVGKVLLVP